MTRISGWPRWWIVLAMMVGLFVVKPLYAQDSGNAPNSVPPNGETAAPSSLPAGWTMLDAGEDGYTRWRLSPNSTCSFSDHSYIFDLPEDPKRMSDIRLNMSNYDVDYFDPQDCEGGPEFDNADLNGKPLGILSGANGSWSVNSWTLTQSDLVKGPNHITIDTDASGTGCWCVGVGYIEVQAKVGFQVVETTPVSSEQNRDFHADKLDLTVTFSTDVDAATINNDTFKLQTRSLAGQMQDVAGSFTLVAPNKFRFVPNTDLLDGVRYYATVFAGDKGVKSASGIQLEATRTWNFWTVPNLDLTDNFSYDGLPSQCPPSNAPCAGVEIAVFQVARNATMVPNKDTVARIYLRWKRHSGIHEDDQLKELTVNVTMNVAPGGGSTSATQTVKRPDKYNEAQVSAALNTINLYHRPASGFNYSVEVTPQPQANVTPVVYKATKSLPSAGKSPTVTFNHYFLRDGEWASSVPSGIRTNALNLLASGAQVTLDMFPAVAVNPVNKGDMLIGYSYTGATLTHPTCGTVKEVMCRIGLATFKRSEPDCINTNMQSLYGGNRVVAVTVPLSVCPNVGGVAFGRVLMLVPTNNAVVVAHEVGHAYNISPANNPNNKHRNIPEGIEGFNVRTKTNRSFQDNTDLPVSLMHTGPVANPASQWVHNDDYAALFSTVTTAQAAQIAAVAAGPYLLVSGFIDLDTNSAQLDALLLQAEPLEPGATGACRAQLLDGGNSVLAEVAFAPGVEIHSWRIDQLGQTTISEADSAAAGGPQPFAVTLPWNESAQSLQVDCGGPVLATQARSATAPSADFVGLADGAVLSNTVTLNWTGSDGDGDGLLYQLQFSEDNGASWRPIGALITTTLQAVDTVVLPSGGNRKVRLLVTDGFNTAFVERTVTIANPLTLLAGDPPDYGEGVALHATVMAIFNTPIDPTTLSSTTFSVTGSYEAVPGTLTLGMGGRAVIFQPTQALAPLTYHTIRVEDTLKDMTGSTLDFDRVWTFRTLTDTVAPLVERISPAEGELDVPINAFIALHFDEALEFGSTTNSLRVLDGNNQPVAGYTNYYSRDRNLVFVPEDDFKPNTTYQVTLPATVKDEAGNALGAPLVWNFTTGSAVTTDARIVGVVGENANDADGDGFYDTLTIYVDVQTYSDFYNLNARLLDKEGAMIQWAKAEFGDSFFEGALDQGVHRLSLTFDGNVIRTHQQDGPYFLDSLNFYSVFSVFGGDTRFNAYQTLPYDVERFAGILSFKPLPDRTLEWNTTRDNAWNLRDYTISLAAPLDEVTYRIVGNSDPRVGVTIDGNNFIDINPDPNVDTDSTITIEARDSAGNRSESSFEVRVQKPEATFLLVSSVIAIPPGAEIPIVVEIRDQFEKVFTGEAVELEFLNTLETAAITPKTVTTNTGRATITYQPGAATGVDTITVLSDKGISTSFTIVIANETMRLPNLYR